MALSRSVCPQARPCAPVLSQQLIAVLCYDRLPHGVRYQSTPKAEVNVGQVQSESPPPLRPPLRGLSPWEPRIPSAEVPGDLVSCGGCGHPDIMSLPVSLFLAPSLSAPFPYHVTYVPHPLCGSPAHLLPSSWLLCNSMADRWGATFRFPWCPRPGQGCP